MKLALMKTGSSVKTEFSIVLVVTTLIVLLPLLALMDLSKNGLSAILTSVLEPSASINFPSGTPNGQKINLEALLLAQKSTGYGKDLSDATQAYQEARLIVGADPSDDGASDCGEFVAVVVRMVYDTSYPLRGTSLQETYAASSSKWQELPENTPEALLEPGDIFVNSLHSFIYTGPQPNGYNTVAASWGGYIPEPSHLFYEEGGQPFKIFRATEY